MPCRGRLLTLVLVGLLTLPVGGWAASNETVNTMPANNSTFFSDLQTFLRAELSAILAKVLSVSSTGGMVISGGTHATAVSCTSATFATEALTSSGQRVTANGSGGAVAIAYSGVGANCANPGSDVCWVAITGATGSSFSNFQRSGSSNYIVDCVSSTIPTLPSNSAWLMKTTITNAAITRVDRLGGSMPLTTPGTYNVKAYGAVGDGSTNDTVAIQRALTAADAAGGGTVFVPEGLYKLTSALSLTHNYTCLVGTGRNSELRQFTAGASVISNGSGGRIFSTCLEKLAMTCSTGITCGTGINWTDVSDSTTRDLWVNTDGGGVFPTAMQIYSTNGLGAYRNNLYNTHLRTQTNASAIALLLTGAGYPDSANSTHIFGGSLRSDSGTALYINQADQVVVTGVTFEGSSLYGIRIIGDGGSTQGNVFTGNRFEGVTNGIVFDATSEGNLALGNTYASGLSTKCSLAGGRNWCLEQTAGGGNQLEMQQGDIHTHNGKFVGGESGSYAFQARSSSSNTTGTWWVKNSGRMGWGNGTGTDDMNFVRNASGNVQVETGLLGFKPSAGAPSPATCSSSTEGSLYYDSTLKELCYCNATTAKWTPVSNHNAGGTSTSCAASTVDTYSGTSFTAAGSAGTNLLIAETTGDTGARFFARGNGRIGWGDGAGTEDVVLVRDSTATVRVESGALGFKPTDTPITCGNNNGGALYFDLSLNELCFCDAVQNKWCKVSSPATCALSSSCN